MQTQQQLNYECIASAIRFIKENRRKQPKLEEVAEHVRMSPNHFQRTFQGYCPKYLSAKPAMCSIPNSLATFAMWKL